MACFKKINFVLSFAMALVFCAPFFPSESPAREKPKRHFLSWESRMRPDEYRHMMKKTESLRRFKVSCRRIAKLKKSSFLNKRPYQFASPVISGSALYVGADSGVFYAFNIEKKKRLWEFRTEGPIHGKASESDGVVYFGDAKANVHALDAATGAEKWRQKLDTEILSTPLVVADKLYVMDGSGRLYALDRETGFELWHTDPNDRSIGFSVRRQSSPVMANGLIITGSSSGTVIAYREGGQIAWVRQIGDKTNQVYDVDNRPLVIGDKVYVSSADGTLACLELASGNILWTAGAGGPNDVVEHGGKIFASGGGVLSALDPATGNIFWHQDLETPEISTPAGGEHYVAVASTKDKFYLIDSDIGDVLYERYIKKGSLSDPIISGDKVYLLINNGRLYSYKVKELPPRKVRDFSHKKSRAAK